MGFQKLSSGGFRRSQKLPTLLVQYETCAKGQLLPRGMWQMAGSPCRARMAHPRGEAGTRELEAALWNLSLACFSFSYWQFHTPLICEFWSVESLSECSFVLFGGFLLLLFFLKEQIWLSSPQPPFHWEHHTHCLVHYLPALTDAWLSLIFLPKCDADL